MGSLKTQQAAKKGISDVKQIYFTLKGDFAMQMTMSAKIRWGPPIPVSKLLKFLLVPSGKQTERARRELEAKSQKFSTHAVAQAFANGELAIGTVIIMKGKTLKLEGVHPGMDFPDAMVFWDVDGKCYQRFTNWRCTDDFQIIDE